MGRNGPNYHGVPGRRAPVQGQYAHEERVGTSSKPCRMRVAFPSRGVARRLGLNRNHTLRVWCDCMDASSGMPWGDENDPRRLGTFDALGFVDSRVPNSALDLYRHHLEEKAT